MPTVASHLVAEEAVVTSTPVDSQGAPSSIEGGALTVTVQSGAGQFTVNGLEVVFFSDVAGETVYSLSGDADLGAGVVNISDTHTDTVTSPQASSLGLGNVVIRPRTVPPVAGLGRGRSNR